MKTGHKDSVLSDNNFICYYLRKENILVSEYELFCESDMISVYDNQITSISNTYSINVLPYLFVLNSLTPKAYFDVLIFFNHYLIKAEVNSEVVSQYILAMHDKVNTTNKDEMIEIDPIGMSMEIICEDETIMLSFLYTIQYLFL